MDNLWRQVACLSGRGRDHWHDYLDESESVEHRPDGSTTRRTVGDWACQCHAEHVLDGCISAHLFLLRLHESDHASILRWCLDACTYLWHVLGRCQCRWSACQRTV